MVGETESGDPVFEIRSVRLVLRPDATHFNRVAECSKCGREMPGAAVLSPADLDLVPHPVICKACVSNAAGPMFDSERRRPLAPAPAPVDTTAGNGSRSGLRAAEVPGDARLVALEHGLADLAAQVASTPVPEVDDIGDRLDALERKLDEAMEQLRVTEDKRLATAGEEQARDWADMGQRVDDIAERLSQDSDSARSRVKELGDPLQELEATVRASDGAEVHRTDLEQVETQLTARLDRLADGVISQRADLLSTIDARTGQVRADVERDVAAMRQDVLEAQNELRRGLVGVNERMHELQQGLIEARARAQSDSAAAGRAQAELVRVETRLTERLEGLVAGVLDQRAELLATIEAGLAAVRDALDRSVAEARVDVLRAVSTAEEHGRTQEELRRAVEDLWEQLNDRFDRWAERSTRVDEQDSEALHAVENGVDESAARLAEALASQRSELEHGFRDALAEAQTAVTAAAAADERRLQALEDRAEQTSEELSQLRTALDDGELARLVEQLTERLERDVGERGGQLQALEESAGRTTRRLSEIDELLSMLDAGFGELKAGIDALKEADAKRVAASDTVNFTYEHFDTQPLPPNEPEPARKLGRKSDVTAQLAATADELARRQRQLEAQMMTLERNSESTIKSAARAASQAAHVGPLSAELKALRQDLWAQSEALEKLTRSVEDLRKKPSAPVKAKPATRAARAKTTKTAKEQEAAPATKRAPRKPKAS